MIFKVDIGLKHGYFREDIPCNIQCCEKEYKTNQIINHMRKFHDPKYEEWQKFIQETKTNIVKKLYELMEMEIEVNLMF